MDDIELCPYCQRECFYLAHGYTLEYLIGLLIPTIDKDKSRLIDIVNKNWILNIKVLESETLVGEIIIREWVNPKSDYSIINYFIIPAYTFEAEEYIEALFREVNLYRDAAEFQDGNHPILMKLSIDL